MAELTDESNVAQGFSMLPVATAVAYMIGFVTIPYHRLRFANNFSWGRSPLIGGILSRPHDRWPKLFSHPFWVKYPYFLPCLAVSAFACLPFTITAMYLKEVSSLCWRS
jgi:hypothetical protein